jgi:hypothetical protein
MTCLRIDCAAVAKWLDSPQQEGRADLIADKSAPTYQKIDNYLK